MIGFAEEGHADQGAIGAVTPAVIGAGEDRRVAIVVAAHLHAAMAARIEEDMHRAGAVAAENYRLLAHSRDKEIASLWDLAFMADEQPGTGKNALLLLGIDVVIDEDLAADLSRCEIDEAGMITPHFVHRHRFASVLKKECQVLRQQHVLVEDDLPPGNDPAVTGPAQRVLA